MEEVIGSTPIFSTGDPIEGRIARHSRVDQMEMDGYEPGYLYAIQAARLTDSQELSPSLELIAFPSYAQSSVPASKLAAYEHIQVSGPTKRGFENRAFRVI